MRSLLKEHLAIGTIGVMAFAVTVYFQSAVKKGSERRLMAPPPEYIEFMHFGFRQSLADSLWLRWIQDGDVCFAYFGEVKVEPAPNRMVEEIKKDFLYNPRHKVCNQSWGFKMLDAVTKLDPMFKMPYLAGTMSLSVLVEDYEGTTVLFERGLKVYPDDWNLNYRAAYHFLFDKRDVNRAAQLLDHAGKTGGPFWFKSLAARLYSQAGQLELGIAALETYRKMVADLKDNKQALEDIDKRIGQLKADLVRERSRLGQ